MQKPIQHSLENQEKIVWVFLDELNTSPDIGQFRELICDHSLNGEQLPRNLTVLGACNPYRRRKKASTREVAGVENVLATLVYRVYPLPPTMKVSARR